MILHSLIPYLDLARITGTLAIRKYLDSGSTRNDLLPRSKCKTVQQFISTHAGPEIELYESYSYILLCSYMTFAYGLVLPLLLPIAMFSMVNLYISEKLLLTYFYRKPQMMDNSLYDGVL